MTFLNNSAGTTSYHNHSTYSDGTTDIETMVKAAEEAGLEEFGMSDHLVLHPDFPEIIDWSIDPKRIPEYIAECRQLAAQSKITVRCALEVDYFPEKVAEISQLDKYDFDYLIGSVHFVGKFPVDEAAKFWSELTQTERDDCIIRYWQLIKEMADSRLFHIAGHLDLYKKFNYHPSTFPEKEVDQALDAIQAAGMAVELNTAGWAKVCSECYPSATIMQKCKERGIPIIITADSHAPEHVNAFYDRAQSLLQDL